MGVRPNPPGYMPGLVHFNHLWMEPKEEVIFAVPIARHEATWMVVECMVLMCCSYC